MMMKQTNPPKTELFQGVLDSVAAREKAVARLEAELGDLYEGYFARIHALLNRNSFATKTEIINLQASQAMIEQLTTILLKSGYEDVIANYLDDYPVLTKAALSYFDAFGLPQSMAGIDEDSLHAWVDFGETFLRDTVERQLINPLESALLQVNMGNQTRDEIIGVVLELSDLVSPKQAVVLVNDTFASYQRAVTTQKADSLNMDIFQYLGPLDKITSDQCEEMLTVDRHGVPGMLYKDEITVSLHPKLTRNPLVGGGHPNCRHQWSPVTEDYAAGKGFELRRAAA